MSDATGSNRAPYSVIFTPHRIYIVEVKNAIYSSFDYSFKQWTIRNHATKENLPCSNPIIQNHNHKKILCESLGIPLDCVTTIEVLLFNGKDFSRGSPYPNDYILSKNELDDLRYILASASKCFVDIDYIHDCFLHNLKQSEINETYHSHNLNCIEYLRSQLKLREKHPYRHTDQMRCPTCISGYLSFDRCSQKWEKRKTFAREKLYLACSNCDTRYDFDDSDDMRKLEKLRIWGIEERNGWTTEETHMNTIWDEMLIAKAKHEEMEHNLKASERKIVATELRYQEAISENKLKDKTIAELEHELKKSKHPAECIKCLLKFTLIEMQKFCSLIERIVIKLIKLIKVSMVA